MATETVEQIGGGVVHKYYASGTGALGESTGQVSQAASFKSFTIHCGSAPATQGENLTISLFSRLSGGGSYNAVVFSLDMSGITDRVVDRQDFDITLAGYDTGLGAADALDVAWANSDGVAWGMEFTLLETNF